MNLLKVNQLMILFIIKIKIIYNLKNKLVYLEN